ncbi:hypothetical protein C823_005465 [Eubacterium plexicaudatum ASF492]|nr:hypothetical protein C823_005465 [Eubacterium plexicaudatum ASF492]
MNNPPFHRNLILLYNGISLERMSTSVLDKVARQPFIAFPAAPLLPSIPKIIIRR